MMRITIPEHQRYIDQDGWECKQIGYPVFGEVYLARDGIVRKWHGVPSFFPYPILTAKEGE